MGEQFWGKGVDRVHVLIDKAMEVKGERSECP